MQFENLEVRKYANDLTLSIYKSLSQNKDYWFKDQIQRASISIMNNIAEWFEKWTIKDKQKYFLISKGSAWEVRSMLYIAFELKYISQEEYENFLSKTYSISKMLSSLIANIKF